MNLPNGAPATTSGTMRQAEGSSAIDWIRHARPRHLVALCSLAIVLLLLDEFSGITRPFDRLTYLLDRSIPRAGVYAVAILLVTVMLLLVVRARSRIVSIIATIVLCWGTFAELAFNLFTQRGFTSDYVAISMRELRMAPQAIKTYAEPRIFVVLFISIAAWIIVYHLARRPSLFGPLTPTRVAVFIFGGLLVFSAGWRIRFDHFGHYPLFARPFLNVTDYYIQQQFIPERVAPTVRLTDEPIVANHIVFMVDEAIRPDFMSLNGFGQPTTPYIDSIQDRLFNFGTAVSGSTCSHNSNLMLNSFVRPEDVGDRKQVLSRPTIFQYAKQAGYRTVFMSAVFRSPLFYGIRESDLDDIDEVVMINELYDGEKHLNDHRLVAELEKILAKYANDRLFVYMRKQGTHFPFDDYYPETEQPFAPVLGSARPMHQYTSRLLNSYLNGIRWNVDSFYRVLDATLPDPEVVYLFTSDHGEYLELKTEGLLHCGEHRTMAMAPLWFDVRGEETVERFREAYGTDFAERNRDRASHMNIFPTLLTLMNIATDELTLFDDLSSQVRTYHVEAAHGAFRTLIFDEARPVP